MSKLDLKKTHKELYGASHREARVVQVPEFAYLMVDGQGDPNGPEAQAAFGALFPLAYGLKFLSKGRGQDYAVMPLEGLWWAEDMGDFSAGRMDRWLWTFMILQPEFVTAEDLEAVRAEVERKKGLPGLDKVRLERLCEGRCCQILHIGPYSEEGPTLQKLHGHIDELGGSFDGHVDKHHEIYLSDPRRTAPEKLKTILRQPFHTS